MAATLGIKALLEKHLDKLPQTQAYLESVTESVEDFQIRRVKWAIEEIEGRGEEVREWRILRVAGLRKDLSDDVRKFLDMIGRIH